MEISPGVFVSNVDTTEWVPDDDPAGEMHELVRTSEVWAGLSRFRRAGPSRCSGPSITERRSWFSRARRGSKSPAAHT